MNLRLVFLLFLIFLIVSATTAPSTKKGKKKEGRPSRDGSKKKAKCPQDQKEPSNACYADAVKRCGKQFINNYKKKQGEDLQIPYKVKCSLRETFYTCVLTNKNATHACRGHNKKHHDPKDKKQLQEYLWSTRGCLIGIK